MAAHARLSSVRPGPRQLPRCALAALVALSLVAGGIACSSSTDERAEPTEQPEPVVAESAASDGSLTFALDAEVVDLNPLTHIWSAAEEEVARTAIETLAVAGSYSPAGSYLAQRIVHDDSYVNWTIHLQPGVTLHDGSPMDAELVKELLELMRSSPVHAATLAPMASVDVVSDLELTVTATAPWPQFDDLLATQVGAVADPAWLRSGDGTNPVGTGPFRVTEWDPQRRVVVQRYGGHWQADPPGQELPRVDEIVFVPVIDEGARAAQLEAGTVDVAFTSDPVQIQLALDEADPNDVGPRRVQPEYGIVTAVRLRTDIPPFDNPLAREALTLATNPEAIRESIFSEVDATLLMTPSSTGEVFDPDEAAELAEQLAAGPGGPLTFNLLLRNDPQMLAVAEALREQWAAVGIQARLAIADPGTLAARGALGDDQAMLVDKPAHLDRGATPAQTGGAAGAGGSGAPALLPRTELSPGRLDVALYSSAVAYLARPMTIALMRPIRWLERGG